jgi:hypothetical protein
MSTAGLRLIARHVLLTEGVHSSWWTNNTPERKLVFDKMSSYFSKVGLSPSDIEFLKPRLDTFRHSDLSRYDGLILKECKQVGINPALFKAMALLESSLGQAIKGQKTQKGFIHMTRDTYVPYFPGGTPAEEIERVMLSPEESIPVCARHVKYLIEKFKTPGAVIFSVKNGENKLSKMTQGMDSKTSAEKKESLISDSSYTQASLALRKLFSTDGPMPVGGEY